MSFHFPVYHGNYAAALLLPLSRTVEPPLALASVALVLLLWRYAIRRRQVGYSIWVPVSASLISLVFVATPVALRLRREVTDFTEPNLVPNVDQLQRLVTELPGVLADGFPLWAASIVVVLGLIHPAARRLIIGAWWFWVLALVAVGFAVIFFARVPVDQPYFLRYAFSWWPPFAFAAGAVLSAAIHPGSQRAVAWVGVAALAAVLVATMSALRTDLTTTTRADWRAASETITVSTSDDTTVIFDHVRPFGAYRTPFAGRPRYVDGERLSRSPCTWCRVPNGSIRVARSGSCCSGPGPTSTVGRVPLLADSRSTSLRIHSMAKRGPSSPSLSLPTFSGRIKVPR